MTHPDDLLADYVDGTLGGDELRRVRRHLASCARCSSEVDLAGGARTALASLQEPPVPARVGGAAIEEAHRAGDGAVTGILSRRTAAPVRYRWAAGAAAAAALLVLLLAIPHLGSGPGGAQVAASGEAAANDRTKPADAVEIERRNYDADDVAALALSYRSRAPVPAAPATSSAGGAVKDAPGAFSAELAPDATTCLLSAVPNTGGQLVRLIRARFEGTPAFIGVYLEGPGAGQPPDTVRVWVVSVKGCAILNSTEASI
jgi:Putative zinc-finger